MVRNKTVCLDTMICNWVFRDIVPPTDAPTLIKFHNSKRLVKALKTNGYSIIIPSVVLAEMLCRFPESEQNARYSKLMSMNSLQIVDFTIHTSMILSRILHQRYYVENKAYQNELIEENGELKNLPKHHMKYDAMIFACAVENGANCFYTKDDGFGKYPKGFIDVKGLDEAPTSSVGYGFFVEEEE